MRGLHVLDLAGTPIQNLSGADLGLLYRRSIDVRYCEAKYGGLVRGPSLTSTYAVEGSYFPEYTSAYSGLFIAFCGAHMLVGRGSSTTVLVGPGSEEGEEGDGGDVGEEGDVGDVGDEGDAKEGDAEEGE